MGENITVFYINGYLTYIGMYYVRMYLEHTLLILKCGKIASFSYLFIFSSGDKGDRSLYYKFIWPVLDHWNIVPGGLKNISYLESLVTFLNWIQSQARKGNG